MKILISWIALSNDFDKETGGVNPKGPTVQFHQHFYQYNSAPAYDKHILLSTPKEEQKNKGLAYYLMNTLPGNHQVEFLLLSIEDVISITEIKPKIERLLLEHKEHEIDIFFSPGTSAMQLVWYLCHESLGLKTRLLQTREGKYAREGKPELLEIKTERSTIPNTAILKEQGLSLSTLPNDYLLTDSIRKVYEKAGKIAFTDSVTCLISGNSGTGKERLARFIHEQSGRKDRPFIAVNCSAVGDSLLESRLFGYKKGSFTGAEKDTKGLFEEADGGTIFLDEIGDTSASMQQALLRVLQEKEIVRVGTSQTIKIDVRVIAATHKDLVEYCTKGKFRWDLYYRLAVAELELPTLQERGENEKKQMIEHFITQKKAKLKKEKELKLDKDVWEFVLNYSFPGNIRELENLIESLYVFCEEKVTLSDIPLRFTRNIEVGENTFNWQYHEKRLIEKTLAFYEGNQAQTQLALGYGSINTLKKKMMEYEIKVVGK